MAGIDCISLMSTPAQKPRPVAVRITAVISGRCFTPSSSSAIAWVSAIESALTFGLSMTSSRTPSAVTDWWIVIGAPTPTNRARTGPGWRRCRRGRPRPGVSRLAPKLPGEFAHLGDRLAGTASPNAPRPPDGLTEGGRRSR